MVCTVSLCWVEIRQTVVGVGGFTLKAFSQPLKSLQVDSAASVIGGRGLQWARNVGTRSSQHQLPHRLF